MHYMCVCVWNYVNLLFCCYDVEQIASNISKISTVLDRKVGKKSETECFFVSECRVAERKARQIEIAVLYEYRYWRRWDRFESIKIRMSKKWPLGRSRSTWENRIVGNK